MSINLHNVNTTYKRLKTEPIQYGGKAIRTGIFKVPVSGTVMLRGKNIDGDGQGDLRVHGGTYKAIYGYPFEHYAHWQQELQRDDLTYGQFGENLTPLKVCWKKPFT